MREGHILVDHVSLKVFYLVTLEAARVADLRVGTARGLSRKEEGKRDLTVDPFPLHVVEEPWLVVTLRTRHVSVARSLPGIDVGRHLMAEAAKRGGIGEIEKSADKDEEDDNSGTPHHLHGLQVGLGPFLRHPQEFPPQHPD